MRHLSAHFLLLLALLSTAAALPLSALIRPRDGAADAPKKPPYSVVPLEPGDEDDPTDGSPGRKGPVSPGSGQTTVVRTVVQTDAVTQTVTVIAGTTTTVTQPIPTTVSVVQVKNQLITVIITAQPPSTTLSSSRISPSSSDAEPSSVSERQYDSSLGQGMPSSSTTTSRESLPTTHQDLSSNSAPIKTLIPTILSNTTIASPIVVWPSPSADPLSGSFSSTLSIYSSSQKFDDGQWHPIAPSRSYDDGKWRPSSISPSYSTPTLLPTAAWSTLVSASSSSADAAAHIASPTSTLVPLATDASFLASSVSELAATLLSFSFPSTLIDATTSASSLESSLSSIEATLSSTPVTNGGDSFTSAPSPTLDNGGSNTPYPPWNGTVAYRFHRP